MKQLQAPSSKLQAPKKLQAPSSKIALLTGYWLLVAGFCFQFSAFADGNDRHCGRHSRCDWKHCERHCPRPATVTNTVTVVRTNNVLVNLPGIDVRDFSLQRGHIYRVIVSTRATPEWRSWAVARCTSNQTARVIFPALPKAGVLWQLRDVTPGFAGTVIDGREPDPDAEVVRYLLIRRGVLQKIQ